MENAKDAGIFEFPFLIDPLDCCEFHSGSSPRNISPVHGSPPESEEIPEVGERAHYPGFLSCS
jgi:hypothetical protein